MLRYVLFVYIVLIPFLHALSPVAIQSLGFFLIVAVSPVIALTRSGGQKSMLGQDILLGITLCWGFLAWLFYSVPVEIDRIQGALQWTASGIVSLLLVRKLIILSKVRLEHIGLAAAAAVLVLSVAIVADFYLANYRSEYLSDIIPFSVDKFPKAEILGIFQRPRGLTVEAGFNGIVYECLLPLAFYYFLLRKSLFAFVALASSAVGMLLILSSATLFSFAAAGAALFLLKRRSFFGLIFTFVLIPALIYLALTDQFLFNLFGYKIADFLDLSNYGVAGSGAGRQGAFFYGLELFWEHPFGIGWGTVLQEANIPGTLLDIFLDGNSLISLWLELLVATGVVGFACFAYVMWTNIRGLAEDPAPASGFVMFSLAAVLTHHLFIYDLWFPMIWFSLALAQIARSAEYREYFLSPAGSGEIAVQAAHAPIAGPFIPKGVSSAPAGSERP
jgi:hypothetical protein